LTWMNRAAISVYGLAFYFWKTVLPIHLSPMHALTPYRMAIRGLPFQLSLVAVVWMIAVALLLRRRWPALPVVIAAYAITLVPVLGIFHNGHQITADRYSYLACMGFALLAGAGLLKALAFRGTAAKQIAGGVAVLITAVLGFLTFQQVQVWRDSDTLWRYCLATDPSAIAYNNIGAMMAQQADLISAIEYFRRAVELDPGNGQAHNNFGNTLLHLEDWDAAAREFQAAKEIVPDLVNAHWGLGTALMMQGRLDEAIAELREALRLDPNDRESQAKLKQAQEKKANATAH
jgi:tetratricopeptide (TPR) repeat protein